MDHPKNFKKTRWIYLLLLYSSIYSTLSLDTNAEGTKQLEPTASSFSKFQAGSDKVHNYATYNSPKNRRLYIHIEEPINELIYYGFGKTFKFNLYQPLTGFYRIKDPNGTIVVPSTPIPASGPGFINTRAEALVGPNVLAGGAGGYTATSYKPVLKGDYYIEFDFDSLTTGSLNIRFDFIDITVAKNNIGLTGRLWSHLWSLAALAPENESHAKFYIYTEDSVVTSLDLNGMQPIGFGVMCNSMGTNISTDFIESRKSVHDLLGIYAYPQFKIFLNNPDELVYPSFKQDAILASPSISDCEDACGGAISLDVSKDGLVEMYLDLDSNNLYTSKSRDVFISQPIFQGHNCIEWDGKDGFGKKVNPGTRIRISSTFVTGLTNFPITDAEYNTKGLIVELVRPIPQGVDPSIPVSWDDTKIGGANAKATDCVGPCHTWDISLGNDRTINTWWRPFKKEEIDTVLYLPLPLPALPLENGTICGSASYIFDPGGNFNKYSWNFQGNIFDTKTVHIQSPGEYFLTIEDSNGCKKTERLEISSKNDCVKVPNLITPNEDSENDFFYVEGMKVNEWKFLVVNRWGDLVYQSEKYHNEWNGADLADGIYFYTLEKPNEKKFKGWVEIRR